jgi:hypothetical protein
MTSTTSTSPLTTATTPGTDEAVSKPGPGRRTALAASGFLACALPTVFAINITRMLLSGEYADHRFHQATGQGLILFALWLVPLVGMLRAGWAGRRPSAALGWQHVGFAATGVVTAAIAPGGGAPFLVGVIVITGALVWWALPLRPTLRARVDIDPVLAPVALLGCAVLMPYIVDQLAAQNRVHVGHHAENPHLFDMAWMSACMLVLVGAAALLPATRHLVGWFAGCTLALGGAGLGFGQDATWSLLVLGVGVVAACAAAARGRRETAELGR